MRQVTLLTQPNCTLCHHAKQVLARVARDGDEGRRLAADAGVLFAPGVLLDGRPFGYGRVSERKLRKALAAHTPTRSQPA